MTTIRQQLIKSIHCGIDPFDGFDASKYKFKPHKWTNKGHTFWFNEGIKLTKPELYVEVGSWFGKSARYAADVMLAEGVKDPCVLCVDTWLGSVEHWAGLSRKRLGTQFNHGYPNFYFQFLADAANSGAHYRDVILPFPTASPNAARHLHKEGFKSPFMFIDASHEFLDVYTDLVLCEKLLPEDGGIMVCDDLAYYFPGVKKAIEKFMAEREGEYTLLKNGTVVVALVPTKRQDWISHLKTGIKQLKAELEKEKAEKKAAKLAKTG